MVRLKKVLGQDISREDVVFGCSKIRSEARAAGRLFQEPLGLPEASSAANPRVAAFCGRACGRGGWLPPSPGLSSRRVFHNGRGVSSRGTPSRCIFFFSTLRAWSTLL